MNRYSERSKTWVKETFHSMEDYFINRGNQVDVDPAATEACKLFEYFCNYTNLIWGATGLKVRAKSSEEYFPRDVSF